MAKTTQDYETEGEQIFHKTGVRPVGDSWQKKAQQAGFDAARSEHLASIAEEKQMHAEAMAVRPSKTHTVAVKVAGHRMVMDVDAPGVPVGTALPPGHYTARFSPAIDLPNGLQIIDAHDGNGPISREDAAKMAGIVSENVCLSDFDLERMAVQKEENTGHAVKSHVHELQRIANELAARFTGMKFGDKREKLLKRYKRIIAKMTDIAIRHGLV